MMRRLVHDGEHLPDPREEEVRVKDVGRRGHRYSRACAIGAAGRNRSGQNLGAKGSARFFGVWLHRRLARIKSLASSSARACTHSSGHNQTKASCSPS